MAIVFTSCTSNTKEENDQTNSNIGMPHEGDDQHHDQGKDEYHYNQNMGSIIGHDMDTSYITVQESQIASSVIDSYLELKNDLVADNDKDAARAAKDLVNSFDNIDNSSITVEKISEFKEIIEDAREHADHISKNRGNIEHQREHFEMLGTDIKDLIAIAGADRTLYQIYCPMYNNKKGGTWLSASNEIKNPYYGSKMLNCGEVKSKILIQ